MPQFSPGNGPGSSSTSKQDSGAARQDASQNRGMGLGKPGETSGTGMSKSPTINVSGDDYKSMRQNTAVEGGSRPSTPTRVPIGTSAPKNARTLDRAPPGWLK